MFGDGDGWVHCARRHRHWGLHGAAGLLVRTRIDGEAHLLLQHRAFWSHHGGTWGVPGGARGRVETAEQAALREVAEEVDADLSALQIDSEFVDDHGGWSYTTVLAQVPAAVPVAPRGRESEDVRWVAVRELTGLPLHPGFAASWPTLAPLVDGPRPGR